eukprot:COSAG01_NODE_2410_length_7747_cov_70.111140_4_plen_105_part_00
MVIMSEAYGQDSFDAKDMLTRLPTNMHLSVGPMVPCRVVLCIMRPVLSSEAGMGRRSKINLCITHTFRFAITHTFRSGCRIYTHFRHKVSWDPIISHNCSVVAI